MNLYMQALQKYAELNGRSWRSEYWYFVLINSVVVMDIFLIELVFGIYDILGAIYTFGAIVSAFANTVRRLHDTGNRA